MNKIKKVAFICPPLQGHIFPMIAIADYLMHEDFEVIFIVAEYATKYLLDYPHIVIGKEEFPYEKVKKIAGLFSKRRGIRMGRLWQRQFTRKWNGVVCRYLPNLLKSERVDLVLCDQVEPAAGFVSEYLNIPFITICNSMAIVFDSKLPPFFTAWDYNDSKLRRQINKGFFRVAKLILKRDSRRLRKWEKVWSMEPHTGNELFFATSRLATFCQQVPSLEFPYTETNRAWRYCGPFRTESPYDLPEFPATGKPYIFISLGSLQGSRFSLLLKCAKISNKLGLTPVIAHGNKLNDDQIKKLRRFGIVKDFVAQPQIFSVCKYLISHCGLNTVLDALSYGRPIVALPLGIEQAAIAIKVRRINCGIKVKRYTSKNIRGAIIEVTENQIYRNSAKIVREEIAKRNGVDEVFKFIKSLVTNTNT